MYKVLVKSDTDEEADIKRVAQRIFREIKEAPMIKDIYPALDEEEISDLFLPSLLSILTIMSPKFQSNLKVVAGMSSMIKTVINDFKGFNSGSCTRFRSTEKKTDWALVWMPSNCFMRWSEKIENFCCFLSWPRSPREGLSKESPATLIPNFALKITFNKHMP